MVLGLVAGLYYREFTKANDFTGETQLSVMHTHLLALGMLVFLIVLALDKLFDLSRTRPFRLFFWFYNAGLVVTVAMMFVHGPMDVLGKHVAGAVPGIAGLGHLLTIGLVCLFVSLRARAFGDKANDEPARAAVDALRTRITNTHYERALRTRITNAHYERALRTRITNAHYEHALRTRITNTE